MIMALWGESFPAVWMEVADKYREGAINSKVDEMGKEMVISVLIHESVLLSGGEISQPWHLIRLTC